MCCCTLDPWSKCSRTIAISIYDKVQAFDMAAAGIMSATLLVLSMATLLASTWLSRPARTAHG